MLDSPAKHFEQICSSMHALHLESSFDSCGLEWQKCVGVEHSAAINCDQVDERMSQVAAGARIRRDERLTSKNILQDGHQLEAPNVSYRCVVCCSAGVQQIYIYLQFSPELEAIIIHPNKISASLQNFKLCSRSYRLVHGIVQCREVQNARNL